jgi:hypothetical protein
MSIWFKNKEKNFKIQEILEVEYNSKFVNKKFILLKKFLDNFFSL